MRSSRARSLALKVVAAAVVVGAVAGIAAAATLQNPPVVRTLPWISGRAIEGQTLQARPGRWTGTQPISFAYQWRRCGPFGGNCADIPGATSSRVVLTAADVGRSLRVRVTATNRDGSSRAVSRPTAVVRRRQATPPPPPPPAGPPGQVRLGDGRISIPVTSVSPPQRLVVAGIDLPSPVRSRVPFTGRFRIMDTRGYVVRGALVYVVGIPFNRIRPVPEQVTGTDGWATFTFQPTAQLPLRNGYYLTLFTRARKAGENVLTGVSSRRLVALRLGAPR